MNNTPMPARPHPEPASTALLGSAGQRVLRLYHLYRLVIGLALVALISSNLEVQLLNITQYKLFSYGGWAYLVLNLFTALLMPRAERLAPLLALAVTDLALLCLLFYTGGGTPSGLGNLIVVSVAIANILLHRQIGLLLAALGAAGIIYSTFWLSLNNPDASNQFMQAGSLGMLCFAAALFIQWLVRRLQASEHLVKHQASTVANLEALNASIIERMRTGILVLDKNGQVLQVNQAALNMLDMPCLQGHNLARQCEPLRQAYEAWQANPAMTPPRFQRTPQSSQLQPGFVSLEQDGQPQLLVFLEDTRHYNQQAQQLKLMSLGRLTAGIAHEIRNPLGAISHAAQLLSESNNLDKADHRLSQIIQEQARRLNNVIENVLQLSRQSQPEPQLIDLKYWLYRYVNSWREHSASLGELKLEVVGGHLQTRMDPHQLTQILDNLISNGLRFSRQENSNPSVRLVLFRHPSLLLPVLEIIDTGPGVPQPEQAALFEPFFTTNKKGTGLGLYISRELCEINHARLDYIDRPRMGGCFRITFAHPRQSGPKP